MRKALLFVVCYAAVAAAADNGQEPAFEVAAIHPSGPDSRGPTLAIQPGGRFVAVGFPLRNLITLAYEVADENLRAPGWIASAAYDIEALAGPETARLAGNQQMAQMMARLRRLLADRFQLQMRRETRMRNGVALLVAKGGLRITAAPPHPRGCPPHAQPLTMALLSKSLSLESGQTIFDRTGLSGFYCVALSWTSDSGERRQIGAREGDAPPLRAALQRQLGLAFEARQEPVAVWTVDRVARPSAN